MLRNSLLLSFRNRLFLFLSYNLFFFQKKVKRGLHGIIFTPLKTEINIFSHNVCESDYVGIVKAFPLSFMFSTGFAKALCVCSAIQSCPAVCEPMDHGPQSLLSMGFPG